MLTHEEQAPASFKTNVAAHYIRMLHTTNVAAYYIRMLHTAYVAAYYIRMLHTTYVRCMLHTIYENVAAYYI
jgi:hypothetical protein